MSHGRTDSRETITNELNRAGSALKQMMSEGRSFSGNERNCCFLNMGATPAAGGRFANISAVSGLDYPDDGRAVALVDWDHDGHLDMWISNRNAPRLRLMHNEVPKGNHFLVMQLVGNGESTNRDAIGARVEVVLGDSSSHPPLIKTLRAGEGFLSQSSKCLHFGLGAADVVDKVTVHWPGEDIEQFTGIEVDRRYRLVQGSGTARDITLPARKTNLVSSPQKNLPSSQVTRIPMVELPTVPNSHYVGFDGRRRDLPTETGRLLLVNLWASWCRPCLAELHEFSQRYDELQAKGIDILALSVEGLDGDYSAKAKAARLASERKFPFPVGLATSQLTADFQHLHNLRIPLHLQLPLPVSFLIDRQGRLAVIYKGPVSIDDLLEDVAHSEGSRLERFARSAPIAGRTIRHSQVERTAVSLAASRRFLLASYLQKSGRADQAARQYADVLKFEQDSFMTHNNLGNVLKGQGKIDEAIEHYHQALRIYPDYAEAHNNLGIALRRQGKIDEAIEQYDRALRSEPDHAGAHYNLGNALQSQGKTVKAVEHYHRALQIKPDYAEAHNNLGIALQGQKKIVEAIEHYQQALQIKSDFAEAHNNLGNALRGQGKNVEATEHYQKALRINPDNAGTHNNLGIALQRQGKTAEAVEHYQKALQINPELAGAHQNLGNVFNDHRDFSTAARHYSRALHLNPNLPLALNNLAWIRATQADAELRNGAQAVALAERCCKLTGHRVVDALDTLAAAYAEAGRFDEAIKTSLQAIEMATSAGNEKLAQIIRGRVESYRQGVPHREPSK